MFHLEDKFDHPTRNWQRGSVYVAEKTGQVVLRPGSDSHATLAGTAMHPDCLQAFSAELTWSFEADEGGQLIIAIAKPYEWSQIRDAAIQLRVEQSGRLTVLEKEETRLCEGQLDVSPNMTVSFGREDDHLTLWDGAKRVSVPWPQKGRNKGGFLTVQTLGSQAALLSFQISSPCDTPAFSEVEHLQNVNAWLEWQMQQSHTGLEHLCALASSERDAGR